MEVIVYFLFILFSGVQSMETVKKFSGRFPDARGCVDENCDTNSTLECPSGFLPDPNYPDSCLMCPGNNERCREDCCFPATLQCVYDDKNKKICTCAPYCRDGSATFIFAAQVALGSALAIAFMALLALFWKSFPCRRNPRQHMSSLSREQESSLTSMQRTILQRLRDRPPRYEENNQIRLEKPPPYQEASDDNTQACNTWSASAPPLYCEAVINTETDVPGECKPEQTTSDNRNPTRPRASGEDNGRVNPGFTMDGERTQTQNSETELHM